MPPVHGNTLDLTIDSDDESPAHFAPKAGPSKEVERVKREEPVEALAVREGVKKHAHAEEDPPPVASTSSSSPSPHRSVLFATAEFFPSATALFDACSTRLLAQYGLATVPSKRKPTQVSVRCTLHRAGGCPFRVCAAKEDDGRWVVHLRSCTWDHSHPPGGGEEAPGAQEAPVGARAGKGKAVTPPSPAGSTSSGSLPPPVYPLPGTTFPSALAIYQAYVRALVPSIGFSCIWSSRGDNIARIRCNRSHLHYVQTDEGRCDFEVVLRRVPSSTSWVVDVPESRHEHNHKPHPRLLANPTWRPQVKSSEAREALGLAPMTATDGKGKEKEVVDEPRSDNEGDDDFVSADCLPGLPKPGDIFDSFTDVYLAFMKVYIPAWGIGVNKLASGTAGQIRCNRSSGAERCPWTAQVTKLPTGRFIVDAKRSTLKHNHGAHSKIIADPTWRPHVKNAEARAALGWETREWPHSVEKPEAAVFLGDLRMDVAGASARGGAGGATGVQVKLLEVKLREARAVLAAKR
ncbi:hypothetical protein JCM10449v2_002171 [Rhodotorula kratochvilovae]